MKKKFWLFNIFVKFGIGSFKICEGQKFGGFFLILIQIS